jgi:hypothetical protein
VRVLNIEVEASLLEHWRAWFAPDPQPFLVDAALAEQLGREPSLTALPDELRDTFEVYALPDGVGVVWYAEAEFAELPRATRAALVRRQTAYEREHVPSVRRWRDRLGDAVREQADGRRFVWWPHLLEGRAEDILTEYVEDGRVASRHDEVDSRTWRRAAERLPRARELGGTFAASSGPNCFGTVMAAAGVESAEDVWMLREPFEEWLTAHTSPGGDDRTAGTVLVWRAPDGQVEHAAVALGDGWFLHKPSQGWMSPRKVLRADEVKRSARARGRRLTRRQLLR